jgi:hypothetical protein
MISGCRCTWGRVRTGIPGTGGSKEPTNVNSSRSVPGGLATRTRQVYTSLAIAAAIFFARASSPHPIAALPSGIHAIAVRRRSNSTVMDWFRWSESESCGAPLLGLDRSAKAPSELLRWTPEPVATAGSNRAEHPRIRGPANRRFPRESGHPRPPANAGAQT